MCRKFEICLGSQFHLRLCWLKEPSANQYGLAARIHTGETTMEMLSLLEAGRGANVAELLNLLPDAAGQSQGFEWYRSNSDGRFRLTPNHSMGCGLPPKVER